MPSRSFGKWWNGLARLFRGLIVAGGLVVITLLSAWLTGFIPAWWLGLILIGENIYDHTHGKVTFRSLPEFIFET